LFINTVSIVRLLLSTYKHYYYNNTVNYFKQTVPSKQSSRSTKCKGDFAIVSRLSAERQLILQLLYCL